MLLNYKLTCKPRAQAKKKISEPIDQDWHMLVNYQPIFEPQACSKKINRVNQSLKRG
jgi:hypothetical protein